MDKVDKDIEKLLIDDDRISLYLQGKMSEDEEASFVEELKTNDGLRQRAVAQARLIRGMKQADEELVDAFKQADKQTIQNVIHESREYVNAFRLGGNAAIGGYSIENDEDFIDGSPLDSSKTTNDIAEVKPNKFLLRWLAYAASVIIIFFIGDKGYDYYSTVNLGKQYANTFVLSDIVRGESNTEVENELKGLFDNVINGKDLRKTTERLDAIWQIAKQDTYNDYTDYAPYIGWYLAIGYLEGYEKEKAIIVLNEMRLIYSHNLIIMNKIEIVVNEL